jgi:MarR family transcriptional regulator, transcriptional regulator for hemolysin
MRRLRGADTGAQSLPEHDSAAEALDVIGPLMLEITRAWLKEFDLRLKPLGLSQARWRALYEIWINKGEPLSQSELACRLNVEDPTMARLLDRLEEAGLVRRREDRADRRRRLISLTSVAEEMLQPVGKITRELREAYLANISPKRLEACLAVLRELRGNQMRLKQQRSGGGRAGPDAGGQDEYLSVLTNAGLT